MKAGWKTRPAERLYFENKLELRQLRIMQRAADKAKVDAFKAEANARWINLANPGQTRHQWEQEQRAKGIPT